MNRHVVLPYLLLGLLLLSFPLSFPSGVLSKSNPSPTVAPQPVALLFFQNLLQGVDEVEGKIFLDLREGGFRTRISGTPDIEWAIRRGTKAEIEFKYRNGVLRDATITFVRSPVILQSIQRGHINDKPRRLTKIKFDNSGKPTVYLDDQNRDLILELLWATNLPRHLNFSTTPFDLFLGRPFAGLPTFNGGRPADSFVQLVSSVSEAQNQSLRVTFKPDTLLQFSPSPEGGGCQNTVRLQRPSTFDFTSFSFDVQTGQLRGSIAPIDLSLSEGCLTITSQPVYLSAAKLQFERLNFQHKPGVNGNSNINALGGTLSGKFSLEPTESVNVSSQPITPFAATAGSDATLRGLRVSVDEQNTAITAISGSVFQTNIKDARLDLKGIVFMGGSIAEVYDSGLPFKLTLHEPRSVTDILFKNGAVLTFKEGGKLTQADVKEDQEVRGIPVKAGSAVTFFDDGTVASAILANDFTLQGVPLLRGTKVEFYELNGKIRSGTVSRDHVINGTRYLAGASFVVPEYEIRIANGLALATLPNKSAQVFGWGAVTSGAYMAKDAPRNVPSGLVPSVETRAIQANTKDSLSALVSTYLIDEGIRRQRISGDSVSEANKIRFATAVLSEFYALPAQPTNQPATNTDSSPRATQNTKQFLSKLIQLRGSTAPPDELRQQIQKVLREKNLEASLAAIVLAKLKDVRDLALQPADNITLLTYLNDLASRRPTSALEGTVIATASDASLMLTKELSDSLSVSSLLSNTRFTPIQKAATLPDRLVEVNPLPSTINITYTRSYTTGCREFWEEGKLCFRTYNESISSSKIVPITDMFTGPDKTNDINRLGLSLSYKCFSGNPVTLVSGHCFEPLVKTVSESDTPNVPVNGLGIKHHTWFYPGTTGLVRFKPVVGFRPSPETNWIAIRWKGNEQDRRAISCTSGCLNNSPITVEPNTGWAVYPVIPDSTLEFEVEFAPFIYNQVSGFLGPLAVPTYEEFIEIVEFSSDNSSKFNKIDPVDINQQVSTNGLLSYVAGTQRSFDDPAWFGVTSGNDPNRALELSLSRFALLAKLSTLTIVPSPVFPDRSNPDYNNAPWQERQAFLKAALPSIAFRSFGKHNRSLETQLALISGILPRVTIARDNLSDALNQLGSITEGRANALLLSAAKVLEVEGGVSAISSADNDTRRKLELLFTAIEGARVAVAGLEQELTEAKERRCMVLSLYQFQGFSSFNKIESDPEILKLCTEER